MGLLLLIVVNLLYAGTPTFMRFGAPPVDPLTFVWFRHLLGFLTLVPLLLFLRPIRYGRTDVVRIAVATLLSYTLASFLQVNAMQQSTATSGAMMIAMEPITMLTFGLVFLHERFRPVFGLSILMTMAGFVLFSWGEAWGTLRGNLLYLLGVVCESLFPVLLAPVIRRHPPWQVALTCLGFASLYPLPFRFGGFSEVFNGLPSHSWVSVAYLGVACSAIATLLWLVGVRRFGVSRVALSWFLQPVCGSLLAVIFLGEAMSLPMVLGGLMILAAVSLAIRVKRPLRKILLPGMVWFPEGSRGLYRPSMIPVQRRRTISSHQFLNYHCRNLGNRGRHFHPGL